METRNYIDIQELRTTLVRHVALKCLLFVVIKIWVPLAKLHVQVTSGSGDWGEPVALLTAAPAVTHL